MGHQLYHEAAPFWSCWSRWTCFFLSRTCRRATHHYIKRRKSPKWTKLQCPKGRKQKLDPKISSQTLMLHPLLMLKEKEEVEAKQQASLFGMQHDYSCRNWGGGVLGKVLYPLDIFVVYFVFGNHMSVSVYNIFFLHRQNILNKCASYIHAMIIRLTIRSGRFC